MNRKRTLSLDSARASLKLRKRRGYNANQAIDVFSLAEAEGVVVRFVGINSMEGMYYANDPPTILLPSERPAGRLAFSCAHELGHHVFRHGSRLDSLLVEEADFSDEEEWLANMFAAFLLMPPQAVNLGLAVRSIRPDSAEPIEILRVAQWLGVGYATLVNHLALSLGRLSPQRRASLLKHSPRKIAEGTIKGEFGTDIIIVDSHWSDRPIDLRVGEILALPESATFDGLILRRESAPSPFVLCRPLRPGLDRVVLRNGAATYIRASRADYVGCNRFRFLSDPEFEVAKC